MADVIQGISNIIKSGFIVSVKGLKYLFKGSSKKQKNPAEHGH